MTDLEFVQRAAKGDKLAWSEFIDKYSRLIYNYIHSVLKTKGALLSQENIDELFQGLFLALLEDDFRKLKTFKAKNGCSLASWLRQVAINFTIDYLRESKEPVSLDEESEDEVTLKDIISSDSASAADLLSAEEKIKGLNDCIEGLTREDKYFLKLHLNKGLGPEALKEHLGISRPAVDMRKGRIVERLRDCFKSKGFLLDF